MLSLNTKEERFADHQLCEEMYIGKQSSIVMFSDQQPLLLSDVIRIPEKNEISFGGKRQDGTIVWVTLKLLDNVPVQTHLEDIENALQTLAYYCSPTGQVELDNIRKR